MIIAWLLLRRLRRAESKPTCLDHRKLAQLYLWDNASEREVDMLLALVRAYCAGYVADGGGAWSLEESRHTLAEWLNCDTHEAAQLFDEAHP